MIIDHYHSIDDEASAASATPLSSPSSAKNADSSFFHIASPQNSYIEVNDD